MSFDVARLCVARRGCAFVDAHQPTNQAPRAIEPTQQLAAVSALAVVSSRLPQLWSLLNFLLPDIFSDLDSFQRWFDFDSKMESKQGRVTTLESHIGVYKEREFG